MKTKDFIIGGLAVVALILALLTAIRVGNTSPATEDPVLGNKTQSFWDAVGGFRVNGVEVISSTRAMTAGGGQTDLVDANGGTYTLTQAELAAASVFKFTAGGAGQEVIALTLPASSTMDSVIPNEGDIRSWIYDASALATATTTTWTAGTGIDLIAYTTNDDVIDGVEFSQLTCWRKADTDIGCIVSELVRSD